jgi:hypothetical protein
MLARLIEGIAAVLAAAALAGGLTACGGDDDSDAGSGRAGAGTSVEGPQTITGGQTTLTLSSGAIGALSALGVGLEPADPASRLQDTLSFPIESGRVDVDTLSGEIDHEGGVRLRFAGQELIAENLVVDPGRDRITAEVAGRRVPLMAADFGRPRQAPTSDTIVLDGRAATLTPEVIERLGGRIGAEALGEGLRLGRVQVSART